MAGIRRRDFIAAAGSTAVAWPLVAGAQQPERMRRIGVLMALAESEDTRTHLAKFRQELEKLGWSEGQNVRIAVRFAAGKTDQFQTLAKDLVDRNPTCSLHSRRRSPRLFSAKAGLSQSYSSLSPTQSAQAS
jgi:putative tryptophan/tyrosine transport system substrate-binding protein